MILTLTSDFGMQSPYAAVVKGRALAIFPEVQLVDITHALPVFQLQQAAWIFRNAYTHFPKGSFHFLLHDLYTEAEPHLLYVYENEQHVFCANNGFITMLFDDKPVQIFRLDETLPVYDYIHVTDAYLAQMALLRHGNRSGLLPIGVEDLKIRHAAKPVLHDGVLEVQVLYIDAYGNVILNLTKNYFDELRAGRDFKIRFMRYDEISNLSRQYSDVQEGQVLAWFNTGGYLEIAVNKGHAAQLLGFRERGDRYQIYNTVKLFFE